MPGSEWETAPSWLSRSLRRSGLYSSSVCSFHLFRISSASVVSVLYCAHLWMKCSFDNSSFFEEIFKKPRDFLKRSLVLPSCCFPLFVCSLRKASLLLSGTVDFIWYTFPFLPCFLLFFFPRLFVKPPQTTILPSCISFPLGWFWSLPPIKCYKPLYSFSGILSTRSNPLNPFVMSTA